LRLKALLRWQGDDIPWEGENKILRRELRNAAGYSGSGVDRVVGGREDRL
jgi:hypothetical protein